MGTKLGKVKIFFDGIEIEPCEKPIYYPWYRRIKDYFKYRLKKKH